MPPRTQLFSQFPWTGGVNTSRDAALIGPNQLVVGDNLIFDTSGSRKKRDGIDMNWDSNTAGSYAVIGGEDCWFGSTARTQNQIAVLANGNVYKYSAGTATHITDSQTAWTGTLHQASLTMFNNKVFISVDGANNNVKWWDGSAANLYDLPNGYDFLNTLFRTSSGTTRTIQFSQSFPAATGTTIIVTNMGSSSYNGTFTVATVTTTSVSNDTITYTASSSLTEAQTADIGGIVGDNTAPQSTTMRQHLGRLWSNDKNNPDRLHYSQVANHTKWQGRGDSGAIDIGLGDGDPVGIVAIFPTFKGDLFVAKKTKLYRLSGPTPDLMSVELVSNGIGCVSPNSVETIDEQDVVWVSEKGVHSLAASATYGDFTTEYLSYDIQQTFNNSFSLGNIPFCSAGYIPQINSVAFAFTETSSANRVNTGTTSNNALWLYHFPTKAWYRWFDVSCTALWVANDTDEKRFYLGAANGRVSKTFNGTSYDVNASGTQTAIGFHVKTGQILPDGNPYTYKGFKRFLLYYRPQGAHTIAASLTIDNFTLDPNNSLTFNQVSGVNTLGSAFTLGTSLLGYTVVLGCYTGSVDGYGRSIQVELIENGINETVEIQGFAIEWEPAGFGAEMVLRQ